jgi:hypothetical protein
LRGQAAQFAAAGSVSLSPLSPRDTTAAFLVRAIFAAAGILFAALLISTR